MEAGEIIQEFRVTAEKPLAKYAAGAAVPVADVFAVGQRSTCKALPSVKGYAGTIKRHNMASQRASHGNSRSHNVPGSIGMAQDPGRVFPGKRMTGHLGDVTKTTQTSMSSHRRSASTALDQGRYSWFQGWVRDVRPAIKAKASKGAN